MANGSAINNNFKKVILHRGYTPTLSLSATQYLPPTKFMVGMHSGTPSITNTGLDSPVPIANGVVNDDGNNQFTGSSGGDNSTDNTSSYKEGAGVTDNTSQNLIANGTNVLKIWTISNLASAGTNITGTKYIGLWIYIKDATALAKFKTSGTCLEVKFGSDSSNYYSITKVAADLSVGWNWISSNNTIVTGLTQTGTVAGNIDTFIVEITTNNATDTFTTGDVLYDLLRTWDLADTKTTYVSGYPSIDYTSLEATIRCRLTTIQANGFDLDGLGLWNEDTAPLLLAQDTYTDESKSSTDEFAYVIRDRQL